MGDNHPAAALLPGSPGRVRRPRRARHEAAQILNPEPRGRIMKTLVKSIAAMKLGSRAAARTHSWTVWAHSQRDGDYGQHEYSTTTNSEPIALIGLDLHESAFGQELQRQGKHYDSIESL